ncbi:hypothetical protein L211DRAFT_718308 [Terfezia boudieri ATCC MYA-4762]|uniref:Uncharacterized protein n=1 Tax=Terfezia boudieri ATCC MYA-4762 TaxID=1051890 RepID=A0A3N4L6X5_9PEZI|nr:hypothetical protein L211DRAFT_718308 [Terfezia boudieri ATCC MYA-4762]
MLAKGKRMDNPGKEDRINPLPKTRLPVADHPQPPSPVIPTSTDPEQGPHTSTEYLNKYKKDPSSLRHRDIEAVCRISSQLLELIPFPVSSPDLRQEWRLTISPTSQGC